MISHDNKQNDSGISYEDLRSNDMWSLAFLLLLTHNPRFGFCYTFREQNSDGSLISFNHNLFKKLFGKFMRKFPEDKNLIYVLKQMVGYRKFESSKKTLNLDNLNGLLREIN